MPKTTRNILLVLLLTAWTTFTLAVGYETGSMKAAGTKLEAQLRTDLAESDKDTAVLLIAVHKKYNAELKGLLDEAIKIGETMTNRVLACKALLEEQDKKTPL